MPPPAKSESYTSVRPFQTILAGVPIQVVSKPGIERWDSASAAAELIAENITLPRASSVFIPACGHGALGAFVGITHPDSTLVLSDPNVIALEMSKRTLEANGVTGAVVSRAISVLSEVAGKFDAVVMEIPKGRQLLRRWLVETHQALKPSGQLFLAGANDEGIQSAAKDAKALFGQGEVLRYRDRNRAVRFVRDGDRRTALDWAEEPGISPGTWREFEVAARGETYRIRSLPGVFSYDRLDEGSELLLSAMKVPTGARVLDVGCGYGILGMAAARVGAGSVEMTDVNLLAVAAAGENITLNGLTNVTVYPGDALGEVQGRFHLILSNPPFHAGKSVDYQIAEAFISQSRRYLERGGELLIVCNKFIGYDIPMRQFFGHAEVAAENTKFHVLRASRR